MLYGCCPSCRHNVKIEYGRIEENSSSNPDQESNLNRIAVRNDVAEREGPS